MGSTQPVVTNGSMNTEELKRWSFVPVGRVSPVVWAPVTAGLLAVDYFTGPYFQFPAVYIIPVTLAAWFSGAGAGITLAVVLPLTRLAFMLTLWGEPWDSATIVATAITRVAVFSVMAVMAARLADHERALTHEVEVLVSLLPVCAYCRKIRDDGDEWSTLDDYAAKRKSGVSTGLCPDCARARFPEHVAPAGSP